MRAITSKAAGQRRLGGGAGDGASEPDVVTGNPSGNSETELIFDHLNKFVQVINVKNLITDTAGTVDITLRRASDETYETGAAAYIINRNDLVTDSVITAAKVAMFFNSPATVQAIIEVVNAGLAVPTSIQIMMWTDESATMTKTYNVVMDNLDLHDRIRFSPENGLFSGEIIMTRQQ